MQIKGTVLSIQNIYMFREHTADSVGKVMTGFIASIQLADRPTFHQFKKCHAR